jgi:hypothetical protein
MAERRAFMAALSRRIDVFGRKTDKDRLRVVKMYRRFAALAGYF